MPTTAPVRLYQAIRMQPLNLRAVAFLVAFTWVSVGQRESHALAGTKTTARSGGGFGTKSVAFDLIPDATPEIATLVDYLKDQKADIEHVAVGIHPQEQGRGLYVTKNFSKKQGGQLLCKIPSNCVLALTDPSAPPPDEQPLSVGQEGVNLLKMYLHDEARRVQFQAYLNTLPPAVTTATPDFWTKEQIQQLEFPRIVEKGITRKEDIVHVAQANGLDLEELQYAAWLVTSRSIALNVQTAEGGTAKADDRGQIMESNQKKPKIRVLVPLLDLVNHSSDRPNARLTIMDPEKDDSWFALESTRPISTGSEIRIAYGSTVESSVELLLNYGFTPTTANPIDAFMLKKGGSDCLATVNDWSTTLEQDRAQLLSESDPIMAKILAFRIRLKQAYAEMEASKK